jgi:hypothetical protein
MRLHRRAPARPAARARRRHHDRDDRRGARGRPRSPLDVEARLHALKEFLLLPEAGVLAAANKRIANILKKAPRRCRQRAVDAARFSEDAERDLHRALGASCARRSPSHAHGEYARACGCLTVLRRRSMRSSSDQSWSWTRTSRARQPARAAARRAVAVRRRRRSVAPAGLSAPCSISASLLFTAFMMLSACLFGFVMGAVLLAAVPDAIRDRAVLVAHDDLDAGLALRISKFTVEGAKTFPPATTS